MMGPQSLETGSRDLDHAHLRVGCHPKAKVKFDIFLPRLCTKFDELALAIPEL